MALVIEGGLYGNQNVTKNSPVVCDGYVKYDEAEVDRSAIMQDFRDNEKKIMADWRPFWILLVINLSWGILLVILLLAFFIFMVHLFSIFLIT